jgi:hypothetical protein
MLDPAVTAAGALVRKAAMGFNSSGDYGDESSTASMWDPGQISHPMEGINAPFARTLWEGSTGRRPMASNAPGALGK